MTLGLFEIFLKKKKKGLFEIILYNWDFTLYLFQMAECLPLYLFILFFFFSFNGSYKFNIISSFM